jgi:hypothetical protein
VLLISVLAAVPTAHAPAGNITAKMAPNKRTALNQRTALFGSVWWVSILISFSGLKIGVLVGLLGLF